MNCVLQRWILIQEPRGKWQSGAVYGTLARSDGKKTASTHVRILTLHRPQTNEHRMTPSNFAK